MVDFDALMGTGEQSDYSDLMEVFESLDRKTTHTELRVSQREALEELSSVSEGDTVLKISTGAGKTTIGLLFLYRYMKRTEEPVAYLCPTNQLVSQVLREAQALGIGAVHYKRGQQHPGVKAISGEEVIVCTYDKLFNALTTFNRDDVSLRPGAIVLDDAHSGLELIRKSFCLSIKGNIFHEILDALDIDCKAYKWSSWEKIRNEEPNVQMEIPYWIWRNNLAVISEILHKYKSETNTRFVLPYLEENLHLCRCVLSGHAIEISPYYPLVHAVRPFISAKSRLFMSATLADDSSLVRELGCEKTAAVNPVVPTSDKGLGERMVLAPSLIHESLDRDMVMAICQQLSRECNVVVMCSNTKMATEWERFGATVYMEEIHDGIEALKDPSSNVTFAVFVQRYDGVDLADNTARILIIDGMPYGEGVTDKLDSAMIDEPGGARKKIIYRIEQGLGRAVRSHVDFACVLLVGADIANFVAKKDVIGSMNFDTQNQIRLGLELSDLLSKDQENPVNNLVSTMKQCLDRDDAWKRFYKQKVKDKTVPEKQVNSNAVELAFQEQSAFKAALGNDFPKAADILTKAIDNSVLNDSERGLFLQRCASYVNNYDPAVAAEIQQGAFNKNSAVCKPISVVSKKVTLNTVASEVAANWLKQFENPNGAIVKINTLASELDFSNSHSVVEEALRQLAPLIGAQGSRPENDIGEGPDDLWLFPDLSVVIEAKTENQSSIHKSDAEQMLASIQWFERTYTNHAAPIPVFVSNALVADNINYFPAECRVIDTESIQNLLAALKEMYLSLVHQGPIFWTGKFIAQQLEQRGLSTGRLIHCYSKPLK